MGEQDTGSFFGIIHVPGAQHTGGVERKLSEVGVIQGEMPRPLERIFLDFPHFLIGI
jgi:hypothetical protein